MKSNRRTNMGATVSIFTPVYNSEKYIEECIQSVLNQTFSDFDWYIYDDGSKDNSYYICEKYSQMDSRIHLSHGENGECIDRMNDFMLNAKGKYIAFIDNDDYWETNYLKKMIDAIENTDSDCVISSYKMVDSEGNFLEWYTPNLKNRELLTCDELKKRFLTTLDIEGFRWNKIYKTKIIRQSNVKIKNIFPADVNFEYSLFKYVDKIVTIDSKGYYYRQSPNSEVATFSIEKCKSMLGTYERVGNCAISEGYKTEGEYFKAWRYINYLFNNIIKRTLTDDEVLDIFSYFPWDKMVSYSLIELFPKVLFYNDKKNGNAKFMIKALLVWKRWLSYRRRVKLNEQ